MSLPDLILGLLVALLFGARRKDAGAPSPLSTPTPGPVPSTAQPVPTTTTSPWPQTVPAGLPAWPGGWEPDVPVGPGVAARASALLPTLWARGAGARAVEQTAGRWITYVATPMGSKRGVVAYRQRSAAAPAPAATPAAAPTTQAALRQVKKSPVALRTLRQGSRGEDVKVLQRALGANDDGIFGSGTRALVVTYQKTHGLDPDGVVGRKTWSSLLGRAAA
jgi:murein L,D-transpeptidase YcbB/YkuD